MLLDIPWDALAEVGPWGLVTLFVLLIYTGRLVPGKDRDFWRKAFFEQQKITQDLKPLGLIARSTFNSLPEAPKDTE